MSPDLGTYTLNDGLVVPRIGFGTYPLKGDDGIAAIVSAIEVGYRLIDSAVNYENESEVGEAVRRSGVAREDVLVTTKVPGRHHRREETVQSVEESLRRMKFDVLDIVLIHWPNPSQELYQECWEGLIDCRERGLVRSIGVCNFKEHHLDRIITATGVVPSLNQIELHPVFPQTDMIGTDERLGIRTESWSPLGKGAVPFDAEPLTAAAHAHDVTVGQVILRWQLQRGCLPVPKSATPDRQRANLDVLGFELSEQEMAAITGMGRADGRRFSGDPDTHEEM